MSTFVTREDHAGVAHIQINRPEARNSINNATARQLSEAFSNAEADPQVNVLVLSGAGRGFSAGLDLKAYAESGELGEDPERGFAGIAKQAPSKPIIAAIEGFALAGGLEIALACDIIIAASDARMGLPEVTRGLVADGGSLLRLPERLPLAIAMEIALVGEEIPVETLHQWGIVNYVVNPGEAAEVAQQLASKIAKNAPLATAATKQILCRASRAYTAKSWQEQDEISKPVWNSVDANEGAKAFVEKREPVFLGR